MEDARHLFRARTLPYPGHNARLFDGLYAELGHISEEISQAIQRGISDKRILGRLAVYGQDPDRKPVRLELVTKQVDDHNVPVMITAKELLGKYWHRYQEWDIFDAVQMARDLTEARERGETGVDILQAEKPPSPPRR